MSLTSYNHQQLDRLSVDTIKNIMFTNGLTVEEESTDKNKMIRAILNFQEGIVETPNRSINMGILSGPIDNLMYKMENFYNMKANMINELMQMSDGALFALVERMGMDIDLAANSYVIIDGTNIPDKNALIWYLIGKRF